MFVICVCVGVFGIDGMFSNMCVVGVCLHVWHVWRVGMCGMCGMFKVCELGMFGMFAVCLHVWYVGSCCMFNNCCVLCVWYVWHVCRLVCVGICGVFSMCECLVLLVGLACSYVWYV